MQVKNVGLKNPLDTLLCTLENATHHEVLFRSHFDVIDCFRNFNRGCKTFYLFKKLPMPYGKMCQTWRFLLWDWKWVNCKDKHNKCAHFTFFIFLDFFGRLFGGKRSRQRNCDYYTWVLTIFFLTFLFQLWPIVALLREIK